ncbi:hypothetical protein GQ53DRAFT_752460 [Thozetella sp. PMI_491]|nr:hypothetical protein GQ53DRAFT_752460 [Thozetella sp. PMI_491]
MVRGEKGLDHDHSRVCASPMPGHSSYHKTLQKFRCSTSWVPTADTVTGNYKRGHDEIHSLPTGGIARRRPSIWAKRSIRLRKFGRR